MCACACGGRGRGREGGKSYLCDIHICAGRVGGQQPLLEVVKHNAVQMDGLDVTKEKLSKGKPLLVC